MKIAIALPIPAESVAAWKEFQPMLERWCETYRRFTPTVPHDVWCNICGPTAMNPPDEVIDGMFTGAVSKLNLYCGGGCDLGSTQFLANALSNTFLIASTSRVYFWKAGWLERMVAARAEHGPGLYGTSAAYQGDRLHLCTRFFGMDVEDWQAYPHVINTRDRGRMFEIGENNPDGNLLEWSEKRGRPARLVYWGGVYEKADWFKPANIFRRGDQSNMLVKDRHTDIYDAASPEEKSELEKCNAPIVPEPACAELVCQNP